MKLIVILLPLIMSTAIQSETLPKPPVANTVPKKLVHLDDERVDPYYWLREKESPDVIQYLEAENRYTEEIMKPTEKLRQELYREMLGRIKESDTTAPYPQGHYFYYTRTEQGKDYPIYCRKKGIDGPEEILLDGNKQAEGTKYFRVGVFAVSPSEQLLAYSIDTAGDEAYTIHVKDLTSGKIFGETVPNTYYTLEWANDNKTFFYTTLDDAKRPYRIWRHKLGKPADDLIYEEKDQRFELQLSKSRDQNYIFINIETQTTTEVRALKADQPDGQFNVVFPRVQNIRYYVEAHSDEFYIRTNEGATEYKLFKTSAQNPSKTNATVILPSRPGITIEGVSAFKDFLVVHEREKGLEKIRIQNLKNNHVHYVEFPEPAYKVSSGPNAVYDTHVLRFTYTSLTAPASVFDYDMLSRQRDLKKQTEVPGYDSSRYASERIYATAEDGSKIPISLVHRKGFVRNGKAPMLLYGYGSYGLNSDATFSSDRVSLLDRGFVYAIAHIRGGADLGRNWYESGKMLKKKNTFTDFIACAQYLVNEKYTSSDRLTITGRSAGGLLMGAVLNLRPDLFKAAIAGVPFVDALTTDLDPTLPLTIGEYEEWGNANEKEYYEYIKSYSPYDNVARKNYPNLLITAGLNDPRVSYWEPAKWTAKLRTMKTDGNLLLLKTNMGSGHFGSSGRYERLKEIAFEYAFLFRVLGIND